MNKWFAGTMAFLFISAANAADFPVTIDSCGTPVTFTQAPKRAVIHDLNMSEMAFARVAGPYRWLNRHYRMVQNDPEFKHQMGSIPELAPKYPSGDAAGGNPDFFFAGWNYGMKVGGRSRLPRSKHTASKPCAERELRLYRLSETKSEYGPAV
jgi:iron complex transport system substrate-binding protein